MYVKVSIKGDLEENKKLADIIEDICPNPDPHTTLFIPNISPFLIGLMASQKTVSTKDIELSPITTNKTGYTQAGHKTTTFVECCLVFLNKAW